MDDNSPRANNSPQPTEQEIREQLDELKRVWGETIEAKKALQQWYRGEYPVRTLKKENMLIPPFEFRGKQYAEIIDRLAGILNVDVRYSVDAKGIGPRPREHGERVESWLNRIATEIEFYQGEKVNNDLCHDVPNYGYSGKAIYPDPQRWRDYPQYDGDAKKATAYNKLVDQYGKYKAPPIIIRHIPTLTWYPLLAGRTVLKSFELQEVLAAEVRYRYPDCKIPVDIKDTDKLEYVTYLDDTWLGYLIYTSEGASVTHAESLKFWRHSMPVPKGTAPVVLYEGLTTGERELKYRWKGFGQDITDTLEGMDIVIGQQLTLAAATASPTMDMELSPETSIEALEKLQKAKEYVIGGVNVSIPGAKWTEKKFNTTNPVQQYAIEELRRIKDARYPPVLRGEIDASTVGYTYNQATEYALLPVKPIAVNMTTGDVDTARMIIYALGGLEVMAGIPVPVYVRKSTDKGTEAIGATYSDVEDMAGLLRATRDAKLPIDVQANIQAIQMAMDAKMPRRWAYEELGGFENPQELVDQYDAEQLEEQEPFKSAKNNRIAKRMGILNDLQNGVTPQQAGQMGPLDPALQQILAGGGAPPGAPPGMPPPQPPQMGTEMPPSGGIPVSGPQPAEDGVAVTRVRNPRAGQRTQPGGPRRKSGSAQMRSRS